MSSFQLDFEKPLIEIKKRISELEYLQSIDGIDTSSEVDSLKKKLSLLRNEIYKGLNSWQKIQLARHPDRPNSLDYIRFLMEDFVELHGDRFFGDDNAVVAGFAKFRGKKIAVLGQQKGRETSERIFRNFGMMNPEGYRKALRVMKLAEKFNLPVVSFIDTLGAFPGIGAKKEGKRKRLLKTLRSCRGFLCLSSL
jgi:acetyl-CoA carboxylase carboxyl transferase subunit alpha